MSRALSLDPPSLCTPALSLRALWFASKAISQVLSTANQRALRDHTGVLREGPRSRSCQVAR